MTVFQWYRTWVGEWCAYGTASGFKCMCAGGVFTIEKGTFLLNALLANWFSM